MPLNCSPEIVKFPLLKSLVSCDKLLTVRTGIEIPSKRLGHAGHEQLEEPLNGRVNVRYSGTETLARVMVEAETEEIVQRITGQIAAALESAIGLGVPSAH
jgi:phosphomannomutase